VALVYVFLMLPIVVVVIASLNSGAYLKFPPEGISLRW
jgi:putative spermidine/putrescine transport system permease protein